MFIISLDMGKFGKFGSLDVVIAGLQVARLMAGLTKVRHERMSTFLLSLFRESYPFVDWYFSVAKLYNIYF